MDTDLAVMLIVLCALYIYPVLSVVLLWVTRHKPKARRALLVTSIALVSVALFGAITRISTTSTPLDWFILTSIYFITSICVWLAVINPNKIVKILGGLMLFIVFGAGYLAGTVGILGVGLTINEYVPESELCVGSDYIYKETNLGNVFAEYRGKRMEVYKIIAWLPIVEWQVYSKSNYNITPYPGDMEVNYSPSANTIYLSTTQAADSGMLIVRDSIRLNR
ncbi:MAG: hypothetical protein JST49_10470 [Bacteroidetes bacterium]|nr:hypothetical protein [Bacteroidota bacterium]